MNKNNGEMKEQLVTYNKFDREQCKNEIFSWHKYLQTQTDKTSIDISHLGLTYISDELYSKCRNLEYLYLEGNELVELSKDFFPSLRRLKWLDIRNNKLRSIPKSVLDHPSLQILLLEGNQIQSLPVEIGSVTSLRGIQLARNPLVFPPPHIVNQGVLSTIDYLRKQWQTLQSPQHIQLFSENHSHAKALTPKSKSSRVRQHKSAVGLRLKANCQEPRGRRPRSIHSSVITGSKLSAAGLSKCISVRPISQSKQDQQNLKPPAVRSNWFTDEESDADIPQPTHYERKSSIQRKKSTTSYGKSNKAQHQEEVHKKELRDIWIEKIRQLLHTQETIIQRRKNSEALKEWQDEARAQQAVNVKRGSEVEISFPYDTDPDYRKMMSRKELGNDIDQKRRNSTLHYTRHEVPINNKIMSIMVALQELQQSQTATQVSPRSEQRVLAQEITKIKEIQRSLNALKLKNFGQLSMTS